MSDKIECGIYAVDYIRESLKEGLVYVLDGSIIHDRNDYFSVSSHVFDFPLKDETQWDQYLDWITRFTWLPEETKEKQITVFITHYPEMMKDNYVDRQKSTTYFYEDVFPFWQDDVVRFMVGGKRRSFKVYIMSGDGTREGQGPTLRPVEYRTPLDEDCEFLKAWFAYGDGTFPEEVEEAVRSMSPGETKLISPNLEIQTSEEETGWTYGR